MKRSVGARSLSGQPAAALIVEPHGTRCSIAAAPRATRSALWPMLLAGVRWSLP
ncbi:MAG TPA: hypothetical protein VFF89_08560 [Sphingobium sp.]|nr:hypothetical protein [Sphingobium sp.]